MKRWLIGGCFMAAYLLVPVFVNWLRHRLHRLTEPTQHLVLAGLCAQVVLIALAGMIWWLA